jgi:hypothetical protein
VNNFNLFAPYFPVTPSQIFKSGMLTSRFGSCCPGHLVVDGSKLDKRMRVNNLFAPYFPVTPLQIFKSGVKFFVKIILS